MLKIGLVGGTKIYHGMSFANSSKVKDQFEYVDIPLENSYYYVRVKQKDGSRA